MPQKLLDTSAGIGQPLEAGGRPLSTTHEQITAILRSRLGQNHADLLALPKASPDGSIAWSTALSGPVVRADALPEAERDKLQQRAERILSEIRGLAQQLAAEGAASHLVAQMLEHSAQTPPGDWLYSVGGKPVLAMWGHVAPGGAPPRSALPAAPVAPAKAAAPTVAPAAASAAAGPDAVAAAAASLSPPPPSPPEEPRGRPPWLRWLLWGLLALLLLALLLWGLKRCTPEAPADADLARQIAEAEARNKALEEQLALQRARPKLQCTPDDPLPPPQPPASAPSAPEPPPDPLQELRERIAAAGTKCEALRKLLKEDVQLKGPGDELAALRKEVTARLAKHCPEREVSKNLQIPSDALKRNDLSFLEGSWQPGDKREELYTTDPNNPIGSHRLVLKLGKDGRGTYSAVEREIRGQKVPDCRGNLRAWTNGKKLYMRSDTCVVPGQPNREDLTIGGANYECEVAANGATECAAVNINDGHRYKMSFRRLR